MMPIKTSENVEFDVIYADGTRHHVREGVLFEVKDNELTLHNGTDRADALIAIAAAAAEVVGDLDLKPWERYFLFKGISHHILGGKDKEAQEVPGDGI